MRRHSGRSKGVIGDLLKSATLPISRVICSLAYSQRAVKKSMMRSIGFFPGYQIRSERVMRLSARPFEGGFD